MWSKVTLASHQTDYVEFGLHQGEFWMHKYFAKKT